ncbi:glucuronate isomerase [Ornithinimicrobium sp. F0845]|uniref:glucuronate isomerase n=1 Tax=Ornithinimicrobium sp. F0845 TaxID=2926412 RepID=UPI001FF4B3CD|nr:glucuronate isomerase [Ornithinimicrobium sp. F0845]MCK0110648.1 glucuronate isomerase [Ornithinimicrobium sp. F0845]
MSTNVLHHDRLLPADPATRRIAREIYAAAKDLPIISPHGHVPPEWLAENTPFRDPTSLLLTPDHYIFRMLHAAGVPLVELGVGGAELDEAGARRAWAHLCRHWDLFLGTPVRYWLEDELVGIFGVTETLSEESADASYDRIAEVIAGADFLPRALMDRFGISVLATTDDPCDDLSHHARLAADDSFHHRVLPTFRPDKYLEPGRSDFPELVARLAEVSGEDTGEYAGYLRALEARRRYFVEHGAVSSDHSHADVVTLTLDDAEASRIYAAALAGTATEDEATALRRHLLVEMARMATEDGLVMTLHPGSYRNHHTPTLQAHGPDTGHDIPIQMEFTRGLQHLLSRFGTAQGFQLILFTLDETVFSREIAPLAGFYPSVYAGAPWWFLDAPEAIGRYRSAVTDTIGFYRTSGFIDDTRAFCSIPARHDMSRRLDAAFLARLVADHRVREDDAHRIARDLVTTIPTRAFKLAGAAS